MRRVRRCAIAATIGLLGPCLMWTSPASAASTITVTPNTDLMRQQQIVHVDGAGFPASATLGVCQGVINGTADQSDCADAFGTLLTATPTGSFSTDLTVRRNIRVPSLGRTVDCAIEDCYVAAAVFSDIAGTAVYSRITFSAGLADGRVKRRSDGVIFCDNVYDFGPGETRSHPIVAGDYWTYALQVQNDGPTTDDITVTASSFSSEGFPAPVQFFYGYYDLTSFMLGTSGFTFRDMAPGEVIPFALRFHVPADAPVGATVNSFVNFASAGAGVTDNLSLYVVVQGQLPT